MDARPRKRARASARLRLADLPTSLARALRRAGRDDFVHGLADAARCRLVYPGDALPVPGYASGQQLLAGRCPAPSVRAFAIHKPRNACTDLTRPFFSAVAKELRGRLAMGANQKGCARLHPIGQLDKNTTGLFLFCTNGDAANYLNLPGTTTKTYVATYIGKNGRSPTPDQLYRLRAGVDVTRPSDGHPTIVRVENCTFLGVEAVVNAPAAHPRFSYRLQLTLSSGANHIVKRLLSACGFPPVKHLARIAISSLTLEDFGEKLSQPGCTSAVELDASQLLAAGLPTEDNLVALKLCQLLCRYRSEGESDERLGEFLANHHTTTGPCFAAFPSLKCRGGVNHDGHL